jgi:hypothetical protein
MNVRMPAPWALLLMLFAGCGTTSITADPVSATATSPDTTGMKKCSGNCTIVDLAPWASGNELIRVQVALHSVKVKDAARYVSDIEDSTSELDLEATLREGDSTRGKRHVGLKNFDINFMTPTDPPQEYPFLQPLLFDDDQIRTGSGELTCRIRILENDQTVSDSDRDKLNRILDTVGGDQEMLVEAKILKAAAAAQWEKYLFVFKMVWDLFIEVAALLDRNEVVEDLTFGMPRDAAYLPLLPYTLGNNFKITRITARLKGLQKVDLCPHQGGNGQFCIEGKRSKLDVATIQQLETEVVHSGRYLEMKLSTYSGRTGLKSTP